MTKRVPSPLPSARGRAARLGPDPGRCARPAAASTACHPDADELQVTFQPVDHSIAPASWFRARLTLRNNDRALCAGRRLAALLQLRASAAGGVPARRARRRGAPAARGAGPLSDARRRRPQRRLLRAGADRGLRPPRPRRDPRDHARHRAVGDSQDGRAGRLAHLVRRRTGPLGARQGAARSKRSQADDRVRGRQAPRGDARHPIRAEHRAADRPRAGRPHPAPPARGAPAARQLPDRRPRHRHPARRRSGAGGRLSRVCARGRARAQSREPAKAAGEARSA